MKLLNLANIFLFISNSFIYLFSFLGAQYISLVIGYSLTIIFVIYWQWYLRKKKIEEKTQKLWLQLVCLIVFIAIHISLVISILNGTELTMGKLGL